ncbi:metal-sensing transcriptional repressor [Alkalibacter saccharofermentans]|uniref:Copper-sensing transcriptional repressor CsoR n=1 Tax=Alkalibacter saccharofermentans DSM 14828 TaxID=1120975 RepID=A0A1M4X8T5_9FIRM|nr:metal-sensing transcriptional repressor [Alkalibacter saccharofermentans]SHE89910.1 DNA-binding transcriptional regulator, FrmR family [Alkalibacter saccharofermentans DSM 14828]
MSHDKMYQINLLKTAKGQIDGIIKMLEDGRYCIDISNQIIAVQGLLKKTNLDVLDNHIKHCVKEAIKEGNEDAKIKELTQILDRLIK